MGTADLAEAAGDILAAGIIAAGGTVAVPAIMAVDISGVGITAVDIAMETTPTAVISDGADRLTVLAGPVWAMLTRAPTGHLVTGIGNGIPIMGDGSEFGLEVIGDLINNSHRPRSYRF